MVILFYVGVYIYQNDLLWLYDVQFLKIYLDNNLEYDCICWQVGVIRIFFFIYDGKSGNIKLCLGYCNDNWYYFLISNLVLVDFEYKGDVCKGEEWYEIWICLQVYY